MPITSSMLKFDWCCTTQTSQIIQSTTQTSQIIQTHWMRSLIIQLLCHKCYR